MTALPAFSQSREVLLSGDTVEVSALKALDFITSAYASIPYEDNPLLEALSKLIDETEGNHSYDDYRALDLVIDAYEVECDLFHHRITSDYGYRKQFGRMHWGIDLSMKPGSNVTVPMDGTVRRVGYDRNGYGLYIIIKHADGLETRYAHLNEALVRPGQNVHAGAVIASSGNSGNSTAPHLHFEIRHHGIPLDPADFFMLGH